MDSIDKLKKYDIKEISTKTKIVQQRIKDIIECNFDKLDKARARGFIHILSREYKIDFDDWLEAYDNFYKEQEKSVQSSESQDVDKKEQIPTIVVDSTMKDKTYIRLLITLATLVVIFIAYFLYKNVFHNDIDNKANISSKELLDDTKLEYDSKGENKVDDNQDVSNSAIDDNGIIEDEMANDVKDSNEVDSENTSSLEENSIDVKQNEVPTQVDVIDELVIKPKAALWIGIIDLDTYQKKQLSTASDYKILLDKNKLIRTGHSYFDMQRPDNSIKKYIGGNNKYFLYTIDGGLKEIKKEDFLSFNRGEEW